MINDITKMKVKLKIKRDEYLFGLVDEYKASGKKHTISSCYEYVKEYEQNRLDEFKSTLSKEEMVLFESISKELFNCLKDEIMFAGFLANNNIGLN